MKIFSKNLTWIFSGIGVAALMIAYNSMTGTSVANGAEGSGNTVGSFTAGNNISGVTIIQSQPPDVDSLGKPLDKKEQPFIGAIDGDYEKADGGYITAEANFDQSEISFVAGNCLFSGKLKQEAGSWDLYLKEKDGICTFLNQLKIGEKIMRIIPAPGSMANSGRVLEFVAQSGEYAIDEFFGIYKLK